MAWAKIDDGWWSHPKVMDLSLAASGLWARALSWSCHQRRDTVPPRFLAMVGADHEHADELVDAGLWHECGDGWAIHDWGHYQEATLSEKRSEAGAKGGRKSGETRRREANAKQTKQPDEAKREAGPTRPVPTQPKGQDIPPSDNGDGGESDADNPPQDSIDHDLDRFEQHFWPAYPATNGRKPEKSKALAQWRKLTVDQQRRALIGAKSLAKADTIPKYAHRFLRKDSSGDFPFDDWQDERRSGPAPGECERCQEPLKGHDKELCDILAEAS